MTDLSRSAEFDLVVQVYSTFEALQQTDPTPERAEVLRLLRPLRALVAHGADPSRYPDDAVEWMRSNMHALINGSLGTPSARALRLQSDPAVIADILVRCDDTAQSRRTRNSDRRKTTTPAPRRRVPSGKAVSTLVAETEGRSDKENIALQPSRLSPNDTAALVGAAATGDRAARDRLFVAIMPMVQRYCRARMGNHDVATQSPADVAQEVCIAAFKALPRYETSGGSFLHLVYAIAADKVTDAYRAASRDKADPVSDLPDLVEEVDRGPEHAAMAGYLKRRMSAELAKLPDVQREVLTLRVSVGLSANETAEALNLSPAHVRVIQHRALTRLRSLMAANPA